MLPGDRSDKWPIERILAHSSSYCFSVRGIWWLSGCKSYMARWMPTPRARNRIVVGSWKLGRSKPTDCA
eukprot:2403840-Pyramimonas_sp.AAC.1